MLSIIVPNYNNGKYIRDCLDSILIQTFDDYEIIIADDHSTDASREIIEEYATKYPSRIRTIFNEENVGVTRNRHNGITASKGEYITTLDSDDYFYLGKKLEHEMRLIQEFKESNEDIMAFSNVVSVTENKEFIKRKVNRRNLKQGNILNYIISWSCEIPLDFIMKREMYFDAGGFNTGIPIYEDWDLKIRLAAKYRFFYTGVDGTAYRKHSYGLSSAPVSKHMHWLLKIFRSEINLVDPGERFWVTVKFLRRLLILYISRMISDNEGLYRIANNVRNQLK